MQPEEVAETNHQAFTSMNVGMRNGYRKQAERMVKGKSKSKKPCLFGSCGLEDQDEDQDPTKATTTTMATDATTVRP
ncbi:hypothetical protein ACA910_018479 [Epithemia clementina (nom. ined.)]